MASNEEKELIHTLILSCPINFLQGLKIVLIINFDMYLGDGTYISDHYDFDTSLFSTYL